jgi:hypothetical protein
LLFDGLNLNQSPISDRCQVIKGENYTAIPSAIYIVAIGMAVMLCGDFFCLIPELVYT